MSPDLSPETIEIIDSLIANSGAMKAEDQVPVAALVGYICKTISSADAQRIESAALSSTYLTGQIARVWDEVDHLRQTPLAQVRDLARDDETARAWLACVGTRTTGLLAAALRFLCAGGPSLRPAYRSGSAAEAVWRDAGSSVELELAGNPDWNGPEPSAALRTPNGDLPLSADWQSGKARLSLPAIDSSGEPLLPLYENCSVVLGESAPADLLVSADNKPVASSLVFWALEWTAGSLHAQLQPTWSDRVQSLELLAPTPDGQWQLVQTWSGADSVSAKVDASGLASPLRLNVKTR